MDRLRKAGSWIALVVVTLAVFVVLYDRTKSVDFERHAVIVESMRTTQHNSAVLKQLVLSSRFGLLNHYDPLTRVMGDLASSERALTTGTREFVGAKPELEQAIAQLDASVDERRRTVEIFKTQNSVLKNSLYYLPVAAEQLIARWSVAGDSSDANRAKATTAINGLVQSALVYNLLRGGDLESRLHGQLAKARDLVPLVPPDLKGDYDLFLAHASAIERQEKIVGPLITKLTDDAIENKVGALDEVYARTFDAALERANWYRMVLYAWALFLLGVVVAVVVKLRRLYANLEALVAARTKALNDALEALWGEMELAKKIQKALVPTKPTLRGCEVAAVMHATDQVGGDYYDIGVFGGKEWILIGDVSGHGVPAGLVMMMCQTAVHTVLTHQPTVSPDQLLAIVNRALTQNVRRLGENKYMTLCAICRDEEGVFHVAGRHQDLYVYRAATGSVETISPAGAWLGILSDLRGKFKVERFELAPEDALLLYTDGVTEAKRAGAMLDGDGLVRIFGSAATSSAEKVVETILQELEGYEVDDDVSIVVVKQRDPVAREVPERMVS